MKKAGIYIAVMLGITILLSGAYYFSYKKTLEKYRENEMKAYAVEEALPIVEEVVPTDTIKEDKITNKTKLVLITYDSKKNEYKEEERIAQPELLGKNREELLTYLSTYMKELSLEEIRKGLIAYEVQSFSKDKITLIKTYDSSSMPYEYYISLAGYEVVVYYCDKKTVFEYTGIDARCLSNEEQKNLLNGIYVLDKEELYGVLENYSS